jgi:hypothetical protein
MNGCNRRRFRKRALLSILLLAAFGIARMTGSADAAASFRHGARLHNPYCSVPTYVRPDLMTQGLADIDADGKGVIFIGRDEALGDRAYRNFLMAHECCHHTRGHLLRLKQMGKRNALLSIYGNNGSFELDADCCAAMSLTRTGRPDAVSEAAKRMRSFGAMPTGGRGYPSGDRRASLIEQCAGSIRQTPMTRPTGG